MVVEVVQVVLVLVVVVVLMVGLAIAFVNWATYSKLSLNWCSEMNSGRVRVE